MRDHATNDGQLRSRGVLLGRDKEDWVWSGHERSALVLGPTRSGKTTSVIIPNILCASHCVVSTSTKSDVLTRTHRARSHAGAVLLFDPSGTTEVPSGVQRIGWSPLSTSREWDGALRTSSAMVAAAHRRSGLGGPTSHWDERAAALLAPLLHAAATTDVRLDEVVRWTDRHQGHDPLERLELVVGRDHPATALLTGLLATDSREQSGIWSTASGVLSAYRSLGALKAARGELLDPNELVRGAHTLYICAPGRHQALLAPLVVGVLGDVQEAAYRRDRSDSPVLFALDELANIAPLPDLPQLVSEGGGQGVLTIGCLQDLSQARTRWGPDADGFLSLFSTTLVLGGVADQTTLRALRDLSGHREVQRTSLSRSQGGRGGPTSSLATSHQREERQSIDALAQGRPGGALVLDAANRLGYVELTVSHRDEPWRSLTERDRHHEIARSR